MNKQQIDIGVKTKFPASETTYGQHSQVGGGGGQLANDLVDLIRAFSKRRQGVAK
jgi:hypothetical protein